MPNVSADSEDQSKSSLFTISTKQMVIEAVSDSVSPAASIDLQGIIIDEKYQILRLLGAGGMGHIYLAKHLLLNKEMAFKTFKSAELGEEAKARFQREAQAIAKLNHQNIVQIFDFGTTSEQVPYYTMELLSGQSLSDKIKATGKLAVEDAISVFSQVCEGLSAAHTKGIVHRDIKPDNIFLTTIPNGHGETLVKLVDFGIAALVSQSKDVQKLTASGMIFGSPLYMSPEQSSGQNVSHQSDIYSCGCALFEALSGKPPFRGPNAFSTLLAHQNAPIPSLKASSGDLDFPAPLEYLLNSMLTKDPQKRIQTIDQVAHALNTIRRGIDSATAEKIADNNESILQNDDAGGRVRHKSKILGFCFCVLAVFIGSAYFGLQPRQSRVTTSISEQQEHNIAYTSSTLPSTVSPPIEEQEPISLYELQKELLKGKSRKCLQLQNKTLDDQDIKLIASNNWLEAIFLPNCEIDNGSLVRFSSHNLGRLNLSESNLSDVGAANILLMKNLHELNVKETQLSGAAISRFASIKKLSHLVLANTKIRAGDLTAFSNCRQLASLDIGDNPKLDGDAVKALGNLDLIEMRLASTSFDDVGFQYLLNMRKLDRVNLRNTSITFNGLNKFCAGSPKLRHIDVSGCAGISSAEISIVRHRFPAIEILDTDSKERGREDLF